MAIFEKRIEAGAALLDEQRPGWEREINLDTLDLASGERCVLGQLYGTFVGGANELRAAWWVTSTESLGFHLRKEIHYPELTEAWKDLIRQRRARASGGEGTDRDDSRGDG